VWRSFGWIWFQTESRKDEQTHRQNIVKRCKKSTCLPITEIQHHNTSVLCSYKRMWRRTWRWTCQRRVFHAACSRHQSCRSSVVQLRHRRLLSPNADGRTRAPCSVHFVGMTPSGDDRICHSTSSSNQLEQIAINRRSLDVAEKPRDAPYNMKRSYW